MRSRRAKKREGALERVPVDSRRIATDDQAETLLPLQALEGGSETASALSALAQARDAGEIWPSMTNAFDPMYDPAGSRQRLADVSSR